MLGEDHANNADDEADNNISLIHFYLFLLLYLIDRVAIVGIEPTTFPV